MSAGPSEAYDYVVVGAGSAGCAVAARLSENADATVALVEAGPPTKGRAIFEVPALFSRQLKSAYDWDLQTEPEASLGGRRNYLPRGRSVGGTSAMNTMLYVRGNRRDYDDWRDGGAQGWGYDDVLPYFLRSEDNQHGANEFHAVGGPLSVGDPEVVDPLLTAWVDGAREAGHPFTDDFNGAQQEGVNVYQVTQRAGLRCSSAKAFLEPAEARPNLTLLHSTQALRIVWERTRAAGIEVDHLGAVRTIRANETMVVCAGAYLTPHLLLQSGIGDASELGLAGVDAVLDLPEVGRNLQDHAGCLLAYASRDTERFPSATAWVEAGGFLRSRPELEIPDLQFHAALGINRDEGLGPADRPGLSFGPYVARPASRGSVRIRTAEPRSKPRIRHNFLTEASDRETLRQGIRMGLEMASQRALRERLEALPDSARAGLLPASDSDADIDAYMRAATFAFYHPCGTCAIGTVTDPELRVLGVEGLRVADTSIMPTMITGNTNAPAIMIGERAAAFIAGSR